MLAPMPHGFHLAHLFPFILLGCLTSVRVQTQLALVIRALDCDHAQPRTGHQIWSQASQVKSKFYTANTDLSLHNEPQLLGAKELLETEPLIK